MCADVHSAEHRSGAHSNAVRFSKQVPPLGRFHICPLQMPGDMPLVHSWVTLPYAKYWGMQGFTVEDVRRGYEEILRHADTFIGYREEQPVFLLETYHPKDDPVGEHFTVQPGDRGMHILVAPAEKPIHEFTWTIFKVVMEFLFDDPSVTRVVVEPDVRNEKIHALNRRAGFQYQKVIQLGHKTAHLAFCTREQFFSALNRKGN